MQSNRVRYRFSMLVRDYIYDSLYNADQGYFTKNIQLGQLKQPIDFKNLMGYEDYMNALHTNYPEYKWLTPSEVFRPYYGITIGNYIHQQFLFARKQKLRIVEVGAGYGAACEGVLYYLRNYAPELFANMEYNIVELSPIACQMAEERLSQDFSTCFKKGNLRIHNTDFLQYRPNTDNKEMWFMLFMEVFDNLPHDKVVDGKQVMIENGVEQLSEMTDPLIIETYKQYQTYQKLQGLVDIEEEPLITRTLKQLIQRYYGKSSEQSIFLPTVSLQVLQHIKKHIQYSSLLIGDFDMLNNQYTRNAINAPIVSKKLKQPHEKQDYDSYLVKRGEADIFFPTDFQFLQHLTKQVLGQESKVYKAHKFVDEFSKSQWTTTKSGYNPLKEDFGNTSFLASDHGQ